MAFTFNITYKLGDLFDLIKSFKSESNRQFDDGNKYINYISSQYHEYVNYYDYDFDKIVLILGTKKNSSLFLGLKRFSCSDDNYILVIKPEYEQYVNPIYVWLFLLSNYDRVKTCFNTNKNGGLKLDTFKDIDVLIPNIVIQEEINRFGFMFGIKLAVKKYMQVYELLFNSFKKYTTFEQKFFTKLKKKNKKPKCKQS